MNSINITTASVDPFVHEADLQVKTGSIDSIILNFFSVSTEPCKLIDILLLVALVYITFESLAKCVLQYVPLE